MIYNNETERRKDNRATDTENVDENQDVDETRTWTKLRMWTTYSNRGTPSD